MPYYNDYDHPVELLSLLSTRWNDPSSVYAEEKASMSHI